MRKVIYSNILKTIAAVLFIASIVLGTLTVTNGVMKYSEEDEEIYSLEKDFSESWYVSHLLDTPKDLMYIKPILSFSLLHPIPLIAPSSKDIDLSGITNSGSIFIK